MSNVLPLPQHVRELIQFALHPIGTRPVLNDSHGIAYRLPYEGDVCLTVFMVCVKRKRWFLPRPPALLMMVTEADPALRIRRQHFTSLLRLPRSEHDMEFTMELVAHFTANTRATADLLGAGPMLI